MEHNDDPFIVRVGTFFLVMGAGSFLLFVTSDLADKVDFDYLFISVLLIFIGWYFRRGKAPPPSAGRFAIIRKSREDAQKKKEEKSKAKQDAKKK
ncbi:MAG: hypothetical protein HY864_09605 [Chloroflexi bacterium]|nr:hypothetical protein [Chloroflexota bacterium]